ncbi:HAMP domain-containing histidine kinase [bacterium]|nr:HAMP domain-containing histidine kinase [bacterium]
MKDIEQNYEDFISTVSHELRTPLTSIRGFSQTMLSSWDKLDDESKKKFIKIIEEQSNRLINMIENMLAVTKLQNQNNHFIFNETNIKNPIKQTVTIVKNQYPTQKFELNIKNNIPNIFVDKDKFQQILTNLIENSAKYSPENSTTMIDSYVQNENVVISVKNIGPEIKTEDYEKIFTKFARLDNPLTRKVQGSGLGLFITKNLVEKMDGKITVSSSPLNDGNNLSTITFTIFMPIKNIEEQARLKCSQ